MVIYREKFYHYDPGGAINHEGPKDLAKSARGISGRT